MKGTFDLKGGVGFCNAVRRSLLADVKTESPCEVTFRCNTSCQTDEFIAHRIGMIPFRRVGNGNEMELKVNGRNAMSSDFVGPAFEPCHEIEVMTLTEDQMLDLTVRFDQRAGSKHARYVKPAAVGMKSMNNGVHRIVFDTIDDENPKVYMLQALDALEERVNHALHQLANQDGDVPRSMC